MKILGLDYGKKRIGYAVGDTTLGLAFGRDCIDNRSFDFVLEEIKKIIHLDKIEKIVVGIPFLLDGTETEQTQYTLSFINQLRKNIDLEIEIQDERLSTTEATKSLYLQNFKAKDQKGKKDVIAAEIILQKYFDIHNR